MKKITLLMLIVFTITAHGQNKLLSSISEQYYNGTWNTSYGANYEYDSNNNLTAETELNWDSNSNSWKTLYKTTYTYNANNKVTEEIHKNWNATTNTLENSEKTINTYSAGKLTESVYYDWQNSNWVNSYKYVVSYNANNLPSIYLSYKWNRSQWVNDERGTFTYNSNNKLTSDIYEDWVGSQWVNSLNSLYTYNSNNKLISDKSADWDEFNTIWTENGSKTEYDWDGTGNKTRETIYYKFSDGSRNQYKDEYTYDTFNLMSNFAHPFKDKTGLDYIFEDVPHINKVQGYNSYSYNQSTSSYTLSSRRTYNYNTALVLGKEKFEIPDSKISVYPNPTKDFLNIQTASNTAFDKVIVTDLSGSTVLQQNQNTTQVNVQNLAKGMYLLQVISGDQKQQTKFLKE
jgi:hypothetical protein